MFSSQKNKTNDIYLKNREKNKQENINSVFLWYYKKQNSIKFVCVYTLYICLQ